MHKVAWAHTQPLSSKRGTNTTVGNYTECNFVITQEVQVNELIRKAKISEGDPPSERASGYGRTTFLKEQIFGEVKSLRKKKS